MAPIIEGIRGEAAGGPAPTCLFSAPALRSPLSALLCPPSVFTFRIPAHNGADEPFLSSVSRVSQARQQLKVHYEGRGAVMAYSCDPNGESLLRL